MAGLENNQFSPFPTLVKIVQIAVTILINDLSCGLIIFHVTFLSKSIGLPTQSSVMVVHSSHNWKRKSNVLCYGYEYIYTHVFVCTE